MRNNSAAVVVLSIVVVILTSTLVAILIFPDFDTGIRDTLTALLGEAAADAVTVISGLIVIIGAAFAIVRRIWPTGAKDQQELSSSDEVPSIPRWQPPESDSMGAETAWKDAEDVARQINEFVHERQSEDPLRNENIPGNMESPEYKELMKRYDAHMDETLRLYSLNLLPEVIRVRDALSEFGIKDSELESLFQRPKKYAHLETLYTRLWEMAARLKRRT